MDTQAIKRVVAAFPPLPSHTEPCSLAFVRWALTARDMLAAIQSDAQPLAHRAALADFEKVIAEMEVDSISYEYSSSSETMGWAARLKNLLKPLAQPAEVSDAELRKALRRAFDLGQVYWQRADSESFSQNRRSGATLGEFEALIAETCAARLHTGDDKDAAIGALVRSKMTSGNSVAVERCTITSKEIEAMQSKNEVGK